MLSKVHSGAVYGVDAYLPSLKVASADVKATMADITGDKCR